MVEQHYDVIKREGGENKNMAKVKNVVKPIVKKMSKSSSINKEILLSKEEVYDVLKFAGSLYSGIYTPQLVNDRLKDISLSPQIATAKDVDDALQNPKQNEQKLLGYSEYFELTSMIYKRVMNYLAGMLSFDLTMNPMNVSDDKEYSSPAYKKDLAIVYDFLDRFNIKKEFPMILRQMVRQEVYFGVLRDDGEKYSMQELPQDYCLITGRFDSGLLFDFNMYYFYQPGIDLNLFPDVFKKMYAKVFQNNESAKNYNPSTSIGGRDSSWVLYHQVSPADGFWAFKFSPEIATRIPYLAPMFPDVVLQPLIRSLQTNSYVAAASKLLIGKIPMLSKDAKGSAVKDAVALSPDLLGKFLALMKSGLGDSIKVGASPLEDMKGITFPNESNYYQDYLKTTTSTSGVNSRLVLTLDKNNAVESQLSINVDEYLMTPLYQYFSEFLEYYINKRTKKYKFKIFLSGTNFFTNRSERLKTQLDLIPFGIINHQGIAAALGLLPQDFERQLMMTKSSGFVDNLTPIISAFQSSGESPKNGRPKTPDEKLGDSGAETRGNDTNNKGE